MIDELKGKERLEFTSYDKDGISVVRNHPLCTDTPGVQTAVAMEQDSVLIGSLVFYDGSGSGMFDVHYLDKFSADNRHPSGFFKSETRKPSKVRVITSRLIDRSVRPLIKTGTPDFQLIVRMVNYDPRASVVRSAITLASDLLIQAGLIDSHIEVHGASWGSHYIWMSTYKSCVTMMEGSLMEMPVKNLIQFLRSFKVEENSIDLVSELDPWADREAAVNITRAIEATYSTDAKTAQLDKVIYSYPSGQQIAQKIFSLYVKSRGRIDDRQMDEVRPLQIQAGLLSKPEQNVLVTRGNTKVLSSLVCSKEPQSVDEVSVFFKEYMNVQYDMLGHAVGTTARMSQPSRREVGHGTLAYNSIKSTKLNDGNAIYIQNDVLRCAGSSSMASVIGSSACMYLGSFSDRLVCGVAVGNLGGDSWVVDLNEAEDWLGYMDLKLASSVEGVTGLQADFKSRLFSVEEIVSVIKLAHEKSLELLDKVKELLKSVQRVKLVREAELEYSYDNDQIKRIIGYKGFNFKYLQSHMKINVDLNKSENKVRLVGLESKVQEAKKYLTSITQAPQKEVKYEAVVVTKMGHDLYLIQPNEAQSGYMKAKVFLHPYSRVLVKLDSFGKGDFQYEMLDVL